MQNRPNYNLLKFLKHAVVAAPLAFGAGTAVAAPSGAIPEEAPSPYASCVIEAVKAEMSVQEMSVTDNHFYQMSEKAQHIGINATSPELGIVNVNATIGSEKGTVAELSIKSGAETFIIQNSGKRQTFDQTTVLFGDPTGTHAQNVAAMAKKIYRTCQPS